MVMVMMMLLLLQLLLLLSWWSASHHSWWRYKRNRSRKQRRKWWWWGRRWWWSTVNCYCCWRDDLLNQIPMRNRIEVDIYIEGTNQDEDDKQKRRMGKKWHIPFTKRRNIYCRVALRSCCTRYYTHAMYPCRGNSYSNSSQERRGRGRVSGITICIVPTRQYIFHLRHTILIATLAAEVEEEDDDDDDKDDNNNDDDDDDKDHSKGEEEDKDAVVKTAIGCLISLGRRGHIYFSKTDDPKRSSIP